MLIIFGISLAVIALSCWKLTPLFLPLWLLPVFQVAAFAGLAASMFGFVLTALGQM